MFYHFNFKGRWKEFKIFFPKRWNAFKEVFYQRYVSNNGWLDILSDYCYDVYMMGWFAWYAFVLNYSYMYMSYIRKTRSYSRQDFFWGFDTTSLFTVTAPVRTIHTKDFSHIFGVNNKGGLGVDSRFSNKLVRVTAKEYPFNLDFVILSENKILKRAQERTYNTFFYYTRRVHNFLLLPESPWPFFASMSAFFLVFGIGTWFSYYEGGLFLAFSGFGLLIFSFYSWCRDFLRETNIFGRLTLLMIRNIKLGFWLFIASEALLFVSFFWAFFHVSLEPAIQIGSIWPPIEGIQMDKLLVPTANTLFLLASGAAFTWVQYHYLAKLHNQVIYGFTVTMIFALFFLLCQWHEYVVAGHQLNDSVFGSTLYLLTAFHGAHVIIGSIFILVSFWRFVIGQFSLGDPVGITLAAWYWHFVDVVWLLVFVWVYLWGTWIPEELTVIFQAGFIS